MPDENVALARPMGKPLRTFNSVSEAAYFASIWGLSNFQMKKLEEAFTQAQGLTSPEVSGSQGRSHSLADREKSAVYSAADELRDLKQSVMECRTLDDLFTVQATLRHIVKAEGRS